MQRKFWLAILISILPSLTLARDLKFSVTPGSMINGASLGVKVGNLIPYFGADLFWVSAEYSSTDDYESDNYWSTETVKVEGSAFLLVPQLGLKWYPQMLSRREDLDTYVKSAFFFSIPSVNVKGERIYQSRYDRNVDNYDISASEEDAAKEVLSFGGLEFGFGSEYVFSPSFSLGAEFGLRVIWNAPIMVTKVMMVIAEKNGESVSSQLTGSPIRR